MNLRVSVLFFLHAFPLCVKLEAVIVDMIPESNVAVPGSRIPYRVVYAVVVCCAELEGVCCGESFVQ